MTNEPTLCVYSVYFHIGNGQPREPALCQLYRHSFVAYWLFVSVVAQTWNWVIPSPGQWVIWVIFHARVTGSSF